VGRRRVGHRLRRRLHPLGAAASVFWRGAGFEAAASHHTRVWHDIFDLQLGVGEKILRAILVYVFLLVVLRLVGKRELGQSSTLDLLVLLLVANAVQNAIIGDDLTVTGAVIGAVTLFAVNEALTRSTYASSRLARFVEGEPTVLIASGKPVVKALRRAGISLAELRAIARRQGFADLGEVKTAILETNGVVTMFGEQEAQLYHPSVSAPGSTPPSTSASF
jgi:uncharacterized membrane protein YcaP (DUF421 family)